MKYLPYYLAAAFICGGGNFAIEADGLGGFFIGVVIMALSTCAMFTWEAFAIEMEVKNAEKN